MPRCTNCGAHVTVHFARVFGDNGDTVHNCLSCSTKTELGADRTRESVGDRVTWAAGGG